MAGKKSDDLCTTHRARGREAGAWHAWIWREAAAGSTGHMRTSGRKRFDSGALSKITRGLRRGGSTLCRKLESRERNITFRGGGGCVVIRHYYRLDTTSPKW